MAITLIQPFNLEPSGNYTLGNVAVTGIVSATGNVTGNYVLGNGAFLTGIAASYGNTNVAAYLASGTDTSNIITTGNITGGNLTTSGLVSVAGSITANGIISTFGNVAAQGNIIGGYIFGNGSQLTGLPAGYANADVAAYLASGTDSSNIITTANVSGGNILTSGAISATGNITGGNILGGANVNATTHTGTTVSVSGNITGGNLITSGAISASGVGYIGGGLSVVGNITATGNLNYQNITDLVVGDPLIYIGANNTADLVDLGIVASANVGGLYQHLGIVRNHSTATWNFFANVVAEPTTVVDWANAVPAPMSAGNITGSNISTVGLISAAGNITGNYFIGNGSQLTGVVATGIGTLTNLSVSGNTTTGNLLTGGVVSAAGNITGGNISTAGDVSAGYFIGDGSQLTGMYGDSNVASYLLVGLNSGGFITTGNVNASYFIGNGSQLTGITSYSNAQVANYLASGTDSSNIVTTANISGGNLLTGGLVSATGNIAGSYFIGNGSQLTGIVSSYANANVANYLASGTITSNIVTTANISSGNVLATGLISTSGNILTSGMVSAIGNFITGGNIIANVGYGYISGNIAYTRGLDNYSGNVAAGNIETTGLISATGSISSYGNIIGGNIVTAGLISATGTIIGGAVSAIANITSGNVLTGGLISATSTITSAANITGGNVLTGGLVSAAGNVSGNYFIGNGSQLTGVAASSVNANALLGNTLSSNVIYSSLTSVGTLTSLSVSGNTTSGNLITPGLISASSNITTSGSVFANGIVSATGNLITESQLYVGNGAQGTGLTNPIIVARATGTAYVQMAAQNTANTGSADLVAYADNGSDSDGWTDMGMTGSGFNDTAYTITYANDGYLFVQGNSLGTGGNLVLATGANGGKDIVFATGGFLTANEKMRFINATGQFYIQTTTTANSSTTGALRVGGGAGIAGNIYSGGLISAVGNIVTVANIAGNNISLVNSVSAGGNVIGNYIIGNGSQLTGLPASYSDANVATYLASGTNSSNIITTANVTGGNLLTSGLVSASANVTGGNILTGGLISAASTITSSANVTGGNILTSGLISATGNLTVGNITTTIANVTTFNSAQGGNVTGTLIATSANAQFINQTNSGGNISAAGNILGNLNLSITANITGGNILTGGLVSATGNVTGGNVLTGGLISAASTVTGTSLLGSVVSVSANITGGNILTGGLISATGNVTGGNVNTGTVRNSAGALTISTGSGNINLTPAGNVVLSANTYINNVGYPAQDADAATKQYVDNLVSTAISYHQAVYAATTTTLATTTGGTITYNQPNGAGNGIGATLTTTGSFNLIDTANVQTAGTRILVKNEGNAVYNGIYTWSNATVITRSTDADEYGAGNPNALGLNDYFFVSSGNVNLGSAWIVDAPSGTITFGTSNISFAQFSQSQVYSANGSAGLSLAGTVFSTKVDNDTTAFDGSGNIIVKASANLTTPNIGAATGTSVSLTANITGGNVLTGGIVSATGTITSSGGTNSTAFAVGNAAVSNVALGFFPTAGTGANMAIRDYSTVASDMFFDVGMGGSAAGAFKFRTTNAFSSVMTANSAGVFTPGVMSATGRVLGLELTSTQSSGDEGGQINLALAATNTTLSGNVIVDIFQNKLRFFEGGGTNRGAYIDLSSASAGVGTNLLAGGGGTPGGSNTYVQFNDGGAFGGNGQFIYDKVNNRLTVGNIVANTNGQGTNYAVGDDAYIGDINTADTIGIKGQQNPANAYIVFGNSDSTGKLGRAGTGPLTYAGAFSASSNITGGNLLTTGLISATGNISSAGNISATYYIGNGSQLTGIVSSYSNANVDAYLPIYSGNISANNISVTTSLTGNIASLSGNVTGGNVLTGGLVSATGNVVSAANVSGGNVLSSALIQGVTISSSGNVVGGNILTGGLITATGNITAANLSLSYGAISTTGMVYDPASYLLTIGGPGPANIRIDGFSGVYAGSGRVISAVGNITGGNINTGGLVTATGNITGGNLLTAGLITATGNIDSAANISATYFIGNGSLLTGISSGSSTKISNGTSEANIGTSNGNANITIGGTSNVVVVANTGVYVTGITSASGNIVTAGNIVTGGGSGGNITGANVISATTVSATANVTGGNILTTGIVSAIGNIVSVGNITGGNILGGANVNATTHTGTTVSVTANVTSGNIFTTGIVSAIGNIVAIGNITGGNVLGGANVNATTHTGTTVSVTANVTGGNILTTGVVSATGNIQLSNGWLINTTATKFTIYFGATAVFSIDSTGNVIGKADVTAYGTP